jgi:hypothetical protein
MSQFISIVLLFIAVVSGIVALITNVVNLKSARKKVKEDTENRRVDKAEINNTFEKQMTFIKNRTQNLEDKMVDIMTMLKSHIEGEVFETRFSDLLRTQTKTITSISSNIHQKYKTLMIYWARAIEDFGLAFYNSEYRKEGKKKREVFLKEDINSLIEEFNTYMDYMIDNIKVDSKGNKIKFGSFVKTIDLHRRTQLLAMSLERNGLDDSKEFTKTFTEYLDDFFSSFLTTIYIWNELEDFKFQKTE